MDCKAKLTEMIIAGTKLNNNITEIDDNANLIYDLGYDSLSLVNLIVEIEEEFGVEVDHENIFVFKKLVDYINSHC